MKSIFIDTGLFTFKLDSSCKSVHRCVAKMYGQVKTTQDGYDFDISIKSPNIFRHFISPQVSFYCDTQTPFFPLPKSQSYPLLEWGMNWCIAAHEYSRLVIHAAVLVKNDKAIVFPALPGSGKSTLSALLSEMGWIVYSDEMAIIELDTLTVKPINRPVCLKNDAIDIVKSRFADSVFTDSFFDTQKGTVAHKRVHTKQEFLRYKDVQIKAIVFPKYKRNVETFLQEVNSANGLLQIIRNSFNYHVLAEKGFETLVNLSESTQFYAMEYSDIDVADEALTGLIE